MLKKLFLFTFAAFALTACNDDKENDNGLPAGYRYAETNELVSDGAILNDILFFGTSRVTTAGQEQAAPFTDKKALFELTGTSQEGKSVLYMHATRFAAKMPAVEMRIPGLPFDGSGKILTTAMASVVPENLVPATNQWFANERYVITDFEGRIEGTVFTATFTCAGRFEVAYTGKLIVNN